MEIGAGGGNGCPGKTATSPLHCAEDTERGGAKYAGEQEGQDMWRRCGLTWRKSRRRNLPPSADSGAPGWGPSGGCVGTKMGGCVGQSGEGRGHLYGRGSSLGSPRYCGFFHRIIKPAGGGAVPGPGRPDDGDEIAVEVPKEEVALVFRSGGHRRDPPRAPGPRARRVARVSP